MCNNSRRVLILFATLASSAATGCETVSHRDIGDEINILIRRNDQLVPPATKRLAAFKRAAIPQIETAMHTAAPTGRSNLLVALDLIGDVEAVPILRQVAVFDITAEVRDAAEAVLTRWAAAGTGARAARSHDALADIARKRAAGHGPLLFGDGGMPGVPSTVGAQAPVGATPTSK
jgi:hypothetical protein